MLKLKHPPVGVVWKLGEGMPAWVLALSLDHDSDYEICCQKPSSQHRSLNFSSDFAAMAVLYWSARREMAYTAHSST
ncbi:hypothetical protein TNCV_1243681 [Trichonephila clavipes]|nr:hypothetical protein TNCV_1243681 [Trichonephila clavipes]